MRFGKVGGGTGEFGLDDAGRYRINILNKGICCQVDNIPCAMSASTTNFPQFV